MCGRYNLIDAPGLRELMQSLGVDFDYFSPHDLPRYNITPTEMVPIVIEKNQKRKLFNARWWLVPSWSNGPSTDYAMFNARAEGLTKSKAYRGPFMQKRCIIPASSFIEWQLIAEENSTQKSKTTKQPYQIQPVESAIAFAGVWDYWKPEQLFSCSIVTTDATDSFKQVHKRMPLMLSPEEQVLWLNTDNTPETLAPVLIPELRKPLAITPISTAINNGKIKIVPENTGDTVIIDPKK